MRRLLTVIITLALALGAGVITAKPAAALPCDLGVKYDPQAPFVVAGDDPQGINLKITVTETGGNCGLTNMKWHVGDRELELLDYGDRTFRPFYDGLWFGPKFGADSYVNYGTQTNYLSFFYGGNPQGLDLAPITVQVQPRVSMSAPKLAVRGTPTTIRGNASYISLAEGWADPEYVSADGVNAALQFRTSLANPWATVVNTTTSAGMSATLPLNEPGYWRWVTAKGGANNAFAAAVSNEVFIDVVTKLPTVTKPPTAPRTPKATSTSTSARLTWVAPASNGGAAISGYQVTGPKTASISAAGRSYTYSGLKPLRTYRLSVRAKNVKGWSAWSSVNVSTKARAPKAYKTCAALNGDYPHGVGKAGAVDRTSGTRVTTFYRSNTAYAMNDGRVKSKKQYDLDYDNDGIACEKR